MFHLCGSGCGGEADGLASCWRIPGHLFDSQNHPWAMSMTLQSAAVISDEQLWQQSRSGDREAFGRIVERYQSLVCSVAYSTCGNLSRSEDLAQETFVTAWRQLGALREPARLGPWLCGIARNHAANATRRENRRGGPAESLDAAAETAAPDADPSEQAASQEEAALLWRWLAELPATYREPLVLFYRQGQSVAEVAGLLDLSEEAVKQRLSRGRVMLREELTTLVASVLTRTRPGPAFTAGVLAVLPLVTATTATSTLAAGAVVGAPARRVPPARACWPRPGSAHGSARSSDWVLAGCVPAWPPRLRDHSGSAKWCSDTPGKSSFSASS